MSDLRVARSRNAFDIDAVIESGKERLDPAVADLYADFARGFCEGLPPHHRVELGELGSVVVDAFSFAQRRAPDEIRVRVRNPDSRPGHTVIEIVQQDRPFIVDSLRLLLRRHGLRERVLLHPLCLVNRDEDGGLVAVHAGVDGSDPDALRESLVVVSAVPRIEDPDALAALEQEVASVMSGVVDVTEDWRKMVRAVRELEVGIEFAGRVIDGGPDRAAKVIRFLDWLVDERFVFMGFRRYTLDHSDDEIKVSLSPGEGLGIWRDDSSSKLLEPTKLADLPPELRDIVRDVRIVIVDKSARQSTVHRQGLLDRVVVKEHDDRGVVQGFAILFGLFTSRAMRTPGSQTPILTERLADILARDGSRAGSNRHRAIVAAFDSIPLEFLLSSEPADLAGPVSEIVAAEGSQDTRLLVRAGPAGRSFYAAVMLPRERYREDLRPRVRAFLKGMSGAAFVDDRTSFIEEGTAIVHFFCTSGDEELVVPDIEALEREIRTICESWEDQLATALSRHFGDVRARALAARYERAFPSSLTVRTHPADAVRDVESLETLAETGDVQFQVYFDTDHETDIARETTTIRMYLQEPILLSDLLPIVDHFGISVVDAQQATVRATGRDPAIVQTLRVLPIGGSQEDLDAIAGRLNDGLGAVLTGRAADDSLNGLVLGAGLAWREVDCMRAYLDYFLQIQGTLMRVYMRGVLLENPLAVRLLVRYHAARLDPSVAESDREERELYYREAFATYRARIASLNEDRALYGLYSLIDATLRTSFFGPEREPHRISFKLDPAQVSELSGARPYREIFVHSRQMKGIHLRGGPVARGGLRWSDRAEDLRVEVLGLMRTQMLKNGLIVPVGAKGGFVLEASGLSPNAARSAADRQYRVFVASLLDITDNLAPDGTVIPPEGVYRRDGDDPYLVVAADKGTAHLSDVANEVAAERDFWLGDAFASGGSEGYDHKKYGITARGAWECVRHHFAELGIDPDDPSSAYTVAGVGDMSGDVFGNGLLLARHARLVAAFDHRNVFLDPDPDPVESWKERKRLFERPRSSWADYDTSLLSNGGGVFSRTAKRIDLSEAARERLGIETTQLSGNEVVQAILAMQVDLFWNGGIGTYVKGSHESDADVGDRSNDAVRIDAKDLRARVVGEGGNLGFTQAARIEAAMHGVRINTDAIDNSAGVDLSDHEVNYKVLLSPLVRSGVLDVVQRTKRLFKVADQACARVLAHNRSQALALSLDELRSRFEPKSFVQAGETLCEALELDPVQLGLPTAQDIAERDFQGLTRPELAVLLGLSKLHTRQDLASSERVVCAYFDALYRGYFPEALYEGSADALETHRLQREITALTITNRIVDAGGATLIPSLSAELGVDASEALCAMLLAEDVLEVPVYRERLMELTGRVPRDSIYAALLELDTGTRSVARYLVRSETDEPDAELILRWQAGVRELREHMVEILADRDARELETRRDALRGLGLPEDLAGEIASLPLADRALNVLRVSERAKRAPLEVADVYVKLGDATGISWVYRRLPRVRPADLWERMLLVDVRWDLLDLQREITEAVLMNGADEPLEAAERFLEENSLVLGRVYVLQETAAAVVTPSTLAVITQRIRGLRRSS